MRPRKTIAAVAKFWNEGPVRIEIPKNVTHEASHDVKDRVAVQAREQTRKRRSRTSTAGERKGPQPEVARCVRLTQAET